MSNGSSLYNTWASVRYICTFFRPFSLAEGWLKRRLSWFALEQPFMLTVPHFESSIFQTAGQETVFLSGTGWPVEGGKTGLKTTQTNLYATSCLPSRPAVRTWTVRNLGLAQWLHGWLPFRMESCRELFLVEHKTNTFREEGGQEDREKTREKTVIGKKKKNTIRLLCKWAAGKTTLPIIALIISFLCEFAYFISLLFIMGGYASILMW